MYATLATGPVMLCCGSGIPGGGFKSDATNAGSMHVIESFNCSSC